MSNRSYVLPGKDPTKPSAALLGESSVVALAETFKVLGDVTRVRLLDALARTEHSVQALADLLGMTQSAVSHQLRLLRSMRLVRTRRDGRQIFYALDDDHIVKLLEQGLEHVNEQAAPAATPRSGRRNPRRGVSERSRWGSSPSAEEGKVGERSS
jgi:DNA-binding transcriptional ArsR family regulator